MMTHHDFNNPESYTESDDEMLGNLLAAAAFAKLFSIQPERTPKGRRVAMKMS